MFANLRIRTLGALVVAPLTGLFFLALTEDITAQHLYRRASAGRPPSVQRINLNVAHPGESPFRVESAALEVAEGQMCLLMVKLTNLGAGHIDRVGLVFSDGRTYAGGVGLALNLPAQGQAEVMALLSKSMAQLTSRVANGQPLTVLPANAFHASQAVYVLPPEQISRYVPAGASTFSPQPCPPAQEARDVSEETTAEKRKEFVVRVSNKPDASTTNASASSNSLQSICATIYSEAVATRDFLHQQTGLNCTLYPYFCHESGNFVYYYYEIHCCAC